MFSKWNFNPIYSLKQLQRICDFWKIVIHKKMLLVIYLLLIYLHVFLPFGLKTLCLWIQSHMSHEAVWGLRYSTQQICQNFPIIPFFWNFHILLYEMNPIEHWNIKEIDPPLTHTQTHNNFRPFQMSLNWNSHYLKIALGKRFFWSYYTFFAAIYKTAY